MSNISSAQVKELRDRTGAGMMDCKKALNETDGSIDEAIQWLRSKGLAAAFKKAGRVAAEGLVAVDVDGKSGVVVEVNSETDFVARNENFQELVKNIAAASLSVNGNYESTANAEYPQGKISVTEAVTQMVGSIGENMQFRRSEGVFVDKGIVVSYVHNSIVPGMGKIGVLIALETEIDSSNPVHFDESNETVSDLGKQLAMHVAATNPQAINIDDMDPEIIQQERNIYTEQAKDSGKPENIIEKMVEGRLRKFYGECVLMEQIFVIDNETKVRDVIDNHSKEIGSSIIIKDFVRFVLGEGIDKQEEDFAAEVAAVKEN